MNTTSTGTVALTASDFDNVYNYSAAGDVNYTLPTASGNAAGEYRFIRNTSSGTLTVTALGAEKIAGSAVSGTIYNDDMAYATLTLQAIDEDHWFITGSHGDWTVNI